MLLSFERTISWEPSLLSYRGPRCYSLLVWCKQSCRSRRTCANGQLGSPGTWEVLSFPRQIPGWSYRVTNSRPRRWVLVRRGAKRTSANRGTTKRRQRSAVGRAAGSRSVLIVPLKQGNSPWRTLWREARRRPADSIEGNMRNTSRFLTMSP